MTGYQGVLWRTCVRWPCARQYPATASSSSSSSAAPMVPFAAPPLTTGRAGAGSPAVPPKGACIVRLQWMLLPCRSRRCQHATPCVMCWWAGGLVQAYTQTVFFKGVGGRLTWACAGGAPRRDERHACSTYLRPSGTTRTGVGLGGNPAHASSAILLSERAIHSPEPPLRAVPCRLAH